MPVVFALATMLSTGLGGLFALHHRRQLHLILGFTAGILLGLVAFDLLPEVFRLAGGATALGVPVPMIAFAGGFLVLHLVERTAAMHSGHETAYGEHHHPNIGLLSAIALSGHSFLDGVGIGLGFQAGAAVGITVAIAVIAHDFADGLNTVGIMTAHGNNRRRATIMLVIDAVAPALGALSTLFFSVSQEVLALYLAFFAGFLLYLATSDILPEAHSRNPSGFTLVCTVLGICLMWTVVAVS